MSKNDIIAKAEILADAIAQSSELAEFHRAEEAMSADESAQRLIAELQIAHKSFMESRQNGGLADKNAIVEIETKMNRNPTIVAYMKAQNTFKEMMQSVNNILASAIAHSSGGCSCENDSCEPNRCSECSGCC